MITITACPVCHSNNLDAEYRQVMSAPYITVELNGGTIPTLAISQYAQCNDCGLLFQSPRQSDDWYDWYYSSGTYRNTLGISQENMDEDEVLRGSNVAKWLKDKITTVVYHMDIGASIGWFLHSIRELYRCHSSGIEPNQNYAQHTYFTKDTSYTENNKPDLVTAIHVLEHVTDPVKELAKWAHMTTRYLLIEVPGANCKGGPLRFAHLYYFPPELLRKMIEDTGMTLKSWEDGDNTRILAEWRE
jgi:hypothetical protein